MLLIQLYFQQSVIFAIWKYGNLKSNKRTADMYTKPRLISLTILLIRSLSIYIMQLKSLVLLRRF